MSWTVITRIIMALDSIRAIQEVEVKPTLIVVKQVIARTRAAIFFRNIGIEEGTELLCILLCEPFRGVYVIECVPVSHGYFLPRFVLPTLLYKQLACQIISIHH